MGHKWLRTAVYSDTMFSDVKSIRGNTCAQVYVTDQLYSRVYPMKSKADAFVTLNDFAHNVGTILSSQIMLEKKQMHNGKRQGKSF